MSSEIESSQKSPVAYRATGAIFLSATLLSVSSFLFYAGCIGFATGIFVRSVFEYQLPQILSAFLVSFVLVLIWHRKSSTQSATYVLACILFLFLFACGSLRMEIASWGEKNAFFENSLESAVSLEGIVVREPEIRQTTQHLYVKVDEELLLVSTDRYADIKYGDVITVNGKLDMPEAFQTDLGRTFDYKGYLHARGVHYVVSFAHVEVLKSAEGNILIAWLLVSKHAFMANIEKVLLQPHAGLAEGLLLGVKQGLGEELEATFRKTGITHIVVLSGYNIMLVVAFVMYFLALILPLRLRLLCGGIAIILFALMVGLSATVVRASAMASLILFAKATGRTYAVMRALCITALVMLFINPYLLVFDVGFQLSFLATLGLIVVAPHLEKHVAFMPSHIGLREFFTATVATQLFLMPILLYQIGEFSIVSIVVNVLVLPMVPVAMFLTFITGIVGFIGESISVPFSYLAYWSLEYILLIARSFAKLPFSSFTVVAFPFYIVILAYICFAWSLWQMRGKKSEILTGVTGWTIVEEESLNIEKNKVQSTSVSATPVFFR